MKHLIFFFFLGLTLCCSTAILGQEKPSKDSLAVKAVRNLSGILSLTTDQQKSLLVIERNFYFCMDSLAVNVPREKHQQVYSVALNDHLARLKQLLSDDQWKKYLSFREAKRSAFLKKAAEQGATVNEVPVNQ